MRKTVTYSVVARVDPQHAERPPLYYARAQAKGDVSLCEIAERIQRRCTVTKADTIAVLTALEQEVCEGLENGKIVRLGDIGSLQIGLNSKGVSGPDEFRQEMIRDVWVNFRPGYVVRRLLPGLVFEHVNIRKR